MSRARLFAASVAAVCLLAGSRARAEATFLPGAGREISRATSASRDAPVFEYAYGPRAQTSFGGEIGFLSWRSAASVVTVGGWALYALENGKTKRVFPPSELWRAQAGVGVAVSLPEVARKIFGRGSDLELSFGVAHESDHQTVIATLPANGVHDVPFGGGGDFFVLDAAWKIPAARTLSIVFRLDDRVYWNALPLVFRARAVSDDLASTLHEAWTNVASAEIVARWRWTSAVQPTLALFGEHLFPHDEFVTDAAFVRALAGVGFPGKFGELMPFFSFDAGNGMGMLVNRRELRLSVGARYALF